MNTLEILNLTSKKQAIEIARWMKPGPYLHKEVGDYCEKCGEQLYIKAHPEYSLSKSGASIYCPHPDPINLDWNGAKAAQVEAIERYGQERWNRACVEIFRKIFVDKAGSFNEWIFWRDYAEPKHYCIASIIAKEQE